MGGAMRGTTTTTRPAGKRHSPWRRALAVTLAVALVTPMAPRMAVAAEGEPARVLLVPLQRAESVSSVVPGRVQEYLHTILDMNARVKVVTPADLAGGPPPPEKKPVETNPTLVKADKALWDAKELAGKGKYLEAVKGFKSAMGLYEKGFDDLVDFDKYVDAALGVALSYFLAEYDDNGEDALGRVLVLRPDIVLDKRKVPAAAIQALARLKAIYGAAELGKVEVTSQPEGADVYLDGVPKGQTPVTIDGLSRGKHVVRVVKDGHKPWAKVVTASAKDQAVTTRLKPDANAVVARPAASIDPKALEAAVASGQLDAAFLANAGAIAEAHRLDAIVLTFIRRAPAGGGYELATFLYEPSIKQVAELEWVQLDSELSNMQVALLSLEERVAQSLVVFPRSRVVAGTSKIYEKPAPVVVKVEPKPEPVAKVEPKPVPVAKVEPKPEPVAKVEPKPEPVAKVEPKPVPVAKVEPRPQPKPEPVVRVEPRPADSVVKRPPVDDGRGGLGNYGRPDELPWQVKQPDDGDKRWYENWWVWAVGAGVAGGVTAVLLATQPSEEQAPGFATTVTWRRGQ